MKDGVSFMTNSYVMLDWPDNVLARYFWSNDIKNLHKYIELDEKGLSLSMKYLTEDERYIFKRFFKDRALYCEIKDELNLDDNIRWVVECIIRKLHDPKISKRFIRYK